MRSRTTMPRLCRSRAVALLAAAAAAATLLCLAPPRAPGAGGAPGVAGLPTENSGIAAPDGSAHFYAVGVRGGTLILRHSPEAEGETLRRTFIRDGYQVPAVAFDGTTGGISADGRRLILAQPFLRPGRTLFAVLDTERLRRTETVKLDGDFSFDALSPDGSMLYLIHYLEPRDPSRYEVRAYDLDAGRLLREPIIDRRVAPQVMRGYPQTRALSGDGVWAYTLYSGGGGAPFVHALNTAEGTALCIDLEMLADRRGLRTVRLEPSADGDRVAVLDRDGATLASISTDSWQATATVEEEDGGGTAWWLGVPLAGAGFVLLGLGVRRRST